MVEISVFISSKMQELSAERQMLFEFIPTLSTDTVQYKAWVFEKDAPASDKSIREIYLDALHDSALYIGLFWNEYGEWTIDEFDRACEWNIPRHIYVKDVEINNSSKKREKILTDFLNNHQDVEQGLTHKWFKTEDDLKAAIEASIKTWTYQHIIRRSGDLRARLFRKAGDIHELPEYFVGREDEIQRLDSYLKDKNARVLIQGFSGEGKTALAAKTASEYINETSSVLWLRLGSSSLDAAYEALAAPFDAKQDMAKAQGDEKRNLLRALLKRENVGMVVLDDSWDDTVLQSLSSAIPHSIPVVMTARNEYSIGKKIPLIGLPSDDAFELLNELSGGVDDEGRAYDICEKLGYLAFAVEVAGRTMQENDWSTHEMLQRLGASHTLEMPYEYRQSGRESVAVLLEQSILSLSEEAQKTFHALGAFFAPSITPELMAFYLHPDNESPPISVVESTLDELQRRALVKYNPATDESVAFYQAHDLSYSYVTTQLGDNERHKALDSCFMYIAGYNEPSHRNFAALAPEIDNFMGAMTFAMQQGFYQDVEEFAWNLFVDAQLFSLGGYYRQAFYLLSQAIFAAKESGDEYNRSAHLGNLGTIHLNLGQYEKAIDCHHQVLEISREIDNKSSECSSLGNLGICYRHLGDYDKAIDYLQQALEISKQTNDTKSRGSTLGNLGSVYINIGQYRQAIDCHRQALKIALDEGNLVGMSRQLSNMGISHFLMGQHHKAIEFYENSLIIKREVGDKQGQANTLNSLGISYRTLGEYTKAIDYFQQALMLTEQIGDIRGQSTKLSNLGIVYQSMGQYEKAIKYLNQALDIQRKIGAMAEVGATLGTLGVAYKNLRQYEKAIELYNQALTIAKGIGDRHSVGIQLGNLGVAYKNLGQYEKAIKYYEQALEIRREISDRSGEGLDLGNLGVAYKNLGQYDKAIKYQEQSLAIAREIGDVRGEGNSLTNLGVAYEMLKNYSKAIECYELALVIDKKLGNKRSIEQSEQNLERANQKRAENKSNSGESPIQNFGRPIQKRPSFGNRKPKNTGQRPTEIFGHPVQKLNDNASTKKRPRFGDTKYNQDKTNKDDSQ